MELFIIKYGLGGGFGGADKYEVVEAMTQQKAETMAYYLACEEYDSFAGMHGLRDRDEIMDEDECDEEEADQIYREDRESWLDYDAMPYSKELEKMARGYHFENPYKAKTDLIK